MTKTLSSNPPSRLISPRLFLFTLGCCYLAAFLSLGVQIRGLVGDNGILPAGELLAAASAAFGSDRFWRLPTLCWWIGTGDAALLGLCLGGAALALLLLRGTAPAAVLALLWLFHLSLVSVGGEFLRFQWDSLLLESGFLAIFLAPPVGQVGGGRVAPPSAVVVFLFRLLLFRLMFASGAAKLLSGDPSWASLSALAVHYETQPLPTPVGWLAHQLPLAAHRVVCAGLLVIELGAPWLLFGPRRARAAAFLMLAGLQVLIAATGNYGFFNLLTLGLCFLALDDDAWPETLGRRLRPASAPSPPARSWPRAVLAPLAVLLIVLGAFDLSRLAGARGLWPPTLRAAAAGAAPFGLVNGYGLFAVMTPMRPEIVVEGSRDGEVWQPYAFRWKPGDPARRPAFVAPHMPRLDWQMWFAALGSVERNPWFVRFLGRLLEGRPEVLRLLEHDPFGGDPPRFVRARLYRYRFTGFGAASWWRREPLGLYVRPVGPRPRAGFGSGRPPD